MFTQYKIGILALAAMFSIVSFAQEREPNAGLMVDLFIEGVPSNLIYSGTGLFHGPYLDDVTIEQPNIEVNFIGNKLTEFAYKLSDNRTLRLVGLDLNFDSPGKSAEATKHKFLPVYDKMAGCEIVASAFEHISAIEPQGASISTLRVTLHARQTTEGHLIFDSLTCKAEEIF